MTKHQRTGLVMSLSLLFLFAASLVHPQDKVANLAGTWTVNVSGDAGSAEQTIVLKQDGGKITGTFKGPRQSGPLEGTVDGNNISFHVATRVPLDYKGAVDGDSMKGSMSGHGKTGSWTATRAK
jgi:hypothetical protein